jgi:hypothetical protein
MADANKYERVIILDDAELLEMVKQKGVLVEEGRSISRMMEDLTKQMDKLTQDMSSLTGKVIAHKRRIFKGLKRATKGQLNEYEIPVNTEIRDGKLVLVVSDAMAEFKDSIGSIDKFTEPVPITRKLKAQ